MKNSWTMRPNNQIKIDLLHGLFTIIDKDLFEIVNKYNWFAAKRPDGKYVVLTHIYKDNKRTSLYLHKLVCPSSLYTDHKDGNTLNNTLVNCRPATVGQNRMNQRKQSKNTKTGYKGVSFNPRYSLKPYTARIQCNKRVYQIGTYKTSKEAADAYDNAAIKFFGEFAATNKQIND